MTNDLSIGLKFSRTYRDEGALNSFDVGALYRPNRFLSIGAVGNQLNRPGEFKRSYTAGLAVRPLGNRLSLFVDGNVTEEERITDGRFLYGAEAEVADGVLIHGSANSDGCLKAGLAINFASLGVGYSSDFEKSDGYTGGSFILNLSQEMRRTVFTERNRLIKIDLSGGVVDEKPEGLLAGLFGGGGETTKDVIDLLAKAREDDTVDGIVLTIGSIQAGWGKLNEIRGSLLELRRAGKRVICYLEGGGNGEYYLASAADRILLNPGGYLLLSGLRTEVVFLKETLDKLGVKADLEHTGEYKTASDLLMRGTMSDAHREMEEWILDDLYSHFVEGIADGRGMRKEEAIEKIDGGPYLAGGAYDAGLVDTLVYEDQVEEVARFYNGGKGCCISRSEFAPQGYWTYDWGEGRKIGLVYASGMMVSGESGYNPLIGGKFMGSATVARAIREARKNESIAAIVLRVDSPGGSGLASEVIRREVDLAKRVKPVVVSMGDVAASAGYHISCGADIIVAEPWTITGSIGAIAGKLNMHGLYDKLGIHKEILTRGENAAIYSDYAEFTPEERELVRALLDESYDRFVRDVALGRGMEWEEVDALARGRVWTGSQAVRNGLVDVLGGLENALDLAMAEAGIEDGVDAEVIVFPRRGGLFTGRLGP
jgi:protease-4